MEQERNTGEENLRQDQQQQRRVRPSENRMENNNNNNQQPHHQPPPPQKCPRCDSSNTKFCYYNNYSLSQPRYFCKACRRYWTHGGTLRNVPVGGGCRKSKRSRSSGASSSASAEVGRTQPVPAALPVQNLTGMISGQSLRALPQILPPVGNSIFAGGEILSSFAAMQSLPAGISQRAAVNLGGGGGGPFGANMALLQGMGFPSLKSQAPQQFQAQNENFSSQQSLIPQRPSSSWTQTFINRGTPSSSAGMPSFWSGTTTVDGGDQVGSSFNPNQWSDMNHPGFNPPQ